MAALIEFNLPPGDAWAVGVSGGADSVALLLLLTERPGLRLHVAHLDHELRGSASAQDAEFVRALAQRLGLPCHGAKRTELEPRLADLPANPSARYRAIRLAHFRQVVTGNNLNGVILAHHADDAAETALQRLIRGAGPSALAGIATDAIVGRLRIIRPLLNIRRHALREFLAARGQPWREDASNENDHYLRNRLRKILAVRPALTDALLDLSAACRQLKIWLAHNAPRLPAEFSAAELAALPPMLAHTAARRWLANAGCPPDQLTAAVDDRLIAMAADAATPPAQQFPGARTVHRRAGKIRLT